MYFHQQCTRVVFSPQSHCCLLSLVFDDNQLNRCEVTAHCAFWLHFPDDWCYWAPSPVSVGHVYVFFGKWFFNTSAHFVVESYFCSFVFFAFELYELLILDVNPSLDIKFATIFSHSQGCLFILLMVSFGVLLLLLSRFSPVRLCATPETAAHQTPPSQGFSRQEHWSGLPFPSPRHESEKWKWSCSVEFDSATPRTAAHQAPPSMGFSRQEYWSGCHHLLCLWCAEAF